MGNNKIENYYGIPIELDGLYYVHYWGNPREMTAQELEKYRRISSWPDQWRIPALAQMNPADHPKIHTMSGRQIVSIGKEQGYVPQFDKFFLKSRKITFITLEIAQAIAAQKAAIQAIRRAGARRV